MTYEINHLHLRSILRNGDKADVYHLYLVLIGGILDFDLEDYIIVHNVFILKHELI